MPKIMLVVGSLLLASCGSSKSDVLTDADIHQASAPDKDIDRLDPELESEAPPPSPEVSIAPLAMPLPTDRPDFDLPAPIKATSKAQGKAKANRDLDSEVVDAEPSALAPAEEPVATAQFPLEPLVPVQNGDGD